ncbi:MAG: hypothetical protein AAF280_10400 [Pseudomonadota bacterium]
MPAQRGIIADFGDKCCRRAFLFGKPGAGKIGCGHEFSVHEDRAERR